MGGGWGSEYNFHKVIKCRIKRKKVQIANETRLFTFYPQCLIEGLL